jgi:carbonic anhydrase/acetyltransferase-like protein (isoleucine patch superfamily)
LVIADAMSVKLYFWFCRIRDRLFTAGARKAFGSIGDRTLLSLPIRLGGEKWISLGADVFVGPQCWFEVIDSREHRQNSAIMIGDQASIAGFCTITACESVVIGPKVLVARNVHLSDHAHAHSSRISPIKEQGITQASPVRICEGAWIGQNVVICPGVTVGRNAVIGANSVVRSDVPDYAVAAGAPAKVVRMIDSTKQ